MAASRWIQQQLKISRRQLDLWHRLYGKCYEHETFLRKKDLT
jgi:hypothetical protein